MIRSKGYYKNQHHRRQLSKILRRDTAKNAMGEDVKYIDEDEFQQILSSLKSADVENEILMAGIIRNIMLTERQRNIIIQHHPSIIKYYK